MLEQTATGNPALSAKGKGSKRKLGPRASQKSKPLFKYGYWWWALPGLLAVLGVHYIATFTGAVYAFTDFSGIGDFNWVGFANFERIFIDEEVSGSIGNTLFLAFGFLILTNIIGLLFALGLNRVLKTRYILRTILFLPVVLASISVSYIWRYIFAPDGALNSLLLALGISDGTYVWLADPTFARVSILIVAVWQNIGMAMVIYLAGLALVPAEMEEAAMLDGAGFMRRFWSITVPMIQPAIAINTTLALTSGLKIFDQVIALTNGGPFGASDTLSTVIYRNTFQYQEYGYGASIALLFSVIIFFAAGLQLFLTRDRGVND
jgi:raffinose/stachyose/melibiose transport system permease protein